MTHRRPPLSRLLAHALLVVALLLQATTTLAMAAGHGLGGAPDHRRAGAAAADATVTPPCHAASPASAVAEQPLPPSTPDCCGPGDHGLCAWACSLVVAAPLSMPIRLAPAPTLPAPDEPPSVLRSRALPVPIEPPRAA